MHLKDFPNSYLIFIGPNELDDSKFEELKSLENSFYLDFTNKINKILHFLPNLALDDVPIGKDEKTNKLIEQFGSIKKFNFKPKSHIELGLKNKQIDFDTPLTFLFSD